MKKSEKVLCIPRKQLDSLGSFQGMITGNIVLDYFRFLTSSEHLMYVDRDQAEEDPSYKQLIPYCVLQLSDSDKQEIFSYERTKKGGESRLYGLRSIGVGGHINQLDVGSAWYERGMLRELDEEVGLLKLNRGFNNEIVGLINLDDTPVNSVHLGVVHLITLNGPYIKTVDPALSKGEFLWIYKIGAFMDMYESWSQLVLREFFKIN